jgi:TRAP-type C4-dicarboxylate transport system substrate-binding protein
MGRGHPAAQQGVIDGADLPIYNINALKVYEVSKYVSMTFHNYGPTLLVMNLDVWKSLTPDQQKLFMESAARRRRRSASSPRASTTWPRPRRSSRPRA